MSHVRTQIRDAVVTLVSGLTATADRIVQHRRPLPQDRLPALRVFVQEEAIERQTIHAPALLERTVAIRIEGVASGEEYQDDLDQIALEVEGAIAADSTLGGLINGGMTPSAVDTSEGNDGDRPVGTLALTYQAQYLVNSDAPDTAL